MKFCYQGKLVKVLYMKIEQELKIMGIEKLYPLVEGNLRGEVSR